jgi:hypothetical protein
MSGRFVKKEPRTAKPKNGTERVNQSMHKLGYKRINEQWVHKDKKAQPIKAQQGSSQLLNTIIAIVAVILFLTLIAP